MTYSQIASLIYELTKTNATSMTGSRMNIFTQPAEQRASSLLMQADGRWQYDDTNYSDLPIALGTLVSGQQDYAFATSQVVVSGVSIADVNGNWHGLTPIDAEDIMETFGHNAGDRAQFFKLPGQPYYYDKQGSSIFLYPAPDNGISVTLTNGLKVYFERGPLVFDFNLGTFTDGSGSTASTPGFNGLFHHLIAYQAALSYCIPNLPEFVPAYTNEVAKLEAQLIQAETKRDKDDRMILSTKRTAFR